MGFLIGMVVAIGCMLGGFAAMGGHIVVIWQPWEYVIIGGSSLGTFVVANSITTIKDTGKAALEAIIGASPGQRDYLDVLGVLYSLMRELRGKARNEVEEHVDNPDESAIFKSFPRVLADKDLTHFICDYCRLIIIGNARTHEIEALMDEEIQTITRDRLKPYHALTSVGDGVAGPRHRRGRARRHQGDGGPGPVARASRRPDRGSARRHVRRHLHVLWAGVAARS